MLMTDRRIYTKRGVEDRISSLCGPAGRASYERATNLLGKANPCFKSEIEAYLEEIETQENPEVLLETLRCFEELTQASCS